MMIRFGDAAYKEDTTLHIWRDIVDKGRVNLFLKNDKTGEQSVTLELHASELIRAVKALCPDA